MSGVRYHRQWDHGSITLPGSFNRKNFAGEQYFLKSDERRDNLEFTMALAERAKKQLHNEEAVPLPSPKQENFFESLVTFGALRIWDCERRGLRLVAVWGVAVYSLNSSQTFVALNLTISSDTRGGGTLPKVVLPSGASLEAL